MYSYIKGTLEEIREDLIVVENNGIGYNIQVTNRILEVLPPRGEQVKIYTYLYVREDAFSLFGFASEDELNMFRLLITVSGIGPKAGLAILSVLSPNEIRFAVAADDIKQISKAPGVGKKTAQRLVIELKDKVSLEDALEELPAANEPASHGNSQVKKEAVQALTALGYSMQEASHVLADIEIAEDADVESVLKLALKHMALL